MKPPNHRSVLLVPLLLLVLAASPAVVAEPPVSATIGVDTGAMDTSVKPGDDFFEYANGAWLKRTEIPPEFSAFGSVYEVLLKTEAQVAALIEDAGQGESEVARKIADFHASFLDEDAIEARGLAPLKPRLDAIAAISDRKALSAYLGSTLLADVDAFNATDVDTDNVLGLWVAADLDEPTRYLPFLLQGGLEMPDRAYYLDDSERMQTFRDALLTHVTNVLGLVGVQAGGGERAKAVVALETRYAEAHASREDTGDLERGTNHWSRADFAKLAPGMDWDAWFAAAGLSDQGRFVVWQPSAVTGLAALVAD